jgi:hypothetical protein
MLSIRGWSKPNIIGARLATNRKHLIAIIPALLYYESSTWAPLPRKVKLEEKV